MFDEWTDGPTTKQVDWYDEKTDSVVKKEVGLKTYERNITPQMRENIRGFGAHVLDFLETQGFEKENILYGMVHMDEGTPHVEVGILCKAQSLQSVKGADGKRVKGADGKYLKSMQDTISYGNAIPQKAKMRKFHENFDEYMAGVYGKNGLILTGATKGNKTAEEMREYREEQANINAQQVALRKAREEAENAKETAKLSVQAELKDVMNSVKTYSETVTAEVNAKSESVERASETLVARTRRLISSEVAGMNVRKSELASSESVISSTSQTVMNTSLSVAMVSENVQSEKAVQTAYASELARTDERLSATASALATRSAEVEQKSLHADNVLKQAEKEKAEAQEHKTWVKTALERFDGLREKANSYLDSLKDWIKGEKEEEEKENKRIISIATAHIMDMEQSGALKSIADAVREEAQEHMDNLETVVSTEPDNIAIDPTQLETPEQAEQLDFSQFEVKPKQNQQTL